VVEELVVAGVVVSVEGLKVVLFEAWIGISHKPLVAKEDKGVA
jgi:hypothetical protein